MFLFLKNKGDGWATSNEVSTGACVAGRTARAHCQRLVALGLSDVAEVFPSHRYRMSKMAGKRNKAMLQRLEEAAAVFESCKE